MPGWDTNFSRVVNPTWGSLFGAFQGRGALLQRGEQNLLFGGSLFLGNFFLSNKRKSKRFWMKVNIGLVHGGSQMANFTKLWLFWAKIMKFAIYSSKNGFVSRINSYKYYNSPIIDIWYLFRPTNIIFHDLPSFLVIFLNRGQGVQKSQNELFHPE